MIQATRRWLSLSAFAACLACQTAGADIASFNDAVRNRDYKTAATEAASTWPTLDKARPDILIIAREFSFMALLGDDPAGAQAYATYAASSDDAAPAAEQAASNVLVSLSALKLQENRANRDALTSALAARAGETGVDTLSLYASSILVGHDFDKGRWADAEASAKLSADLASKGGDAYLSLQRRYQMFEAAARYMRTKRLPALADMVAVQNAIAANIDAASSEALARELAPVYWEARAWALSTSSHLRSRGVMGDREQKLPEYRLAEPTSSVIPQDPPDAALCPTRLDFSRKPEYPQSAMFGGFVGTVILSMDIDEHGKASNVQTLAAVPQRDFDEAVKKSLAFMTAVPDDGYDANRCSLKRTSRVVEFLFSFR